MKAFLTIQKNISDSGSIFIDTLRITASLTIVIYHVYGQYFPIVNEKIGHVPVIIFFVLSGYVIAYSTSNNNRGALQYAAARLVRLYSILLPTLLITALIEIIVGLINPEVLSLWTRGASFPRYLFSMFFLNEIWFLSAAPPINGPLWSLSFEFWYYVIFGLFSFRYRFRLGFLWVLIACFIAGPKILLLLPVWLLGNYAYKMKNVDMPIHFRWILISISLIITGFIVIFSTSFPFNLGGKPLFHSAGFITDFIIGLFIANTLWLLPSEKVKSKTKSKIVFGIRKIGDMTFPLYVLHAPILILVTSIWQPLKFNIVQMLIVLIIVLLISLVIGLVLEKNRNRWKFIFEIFLVRLKNLINYRNTINSDI